MLLLVHHGDAVGADVDPMRPLSAAGRAATTRLAAAAAGRGVRPDVVWHSGKLRARQTAELFWLACNPLAIFSVARGLQPTDPPRRIWEQLAGDGRSILVAGHMPNLTGLLGLFRGAADHSRAFPPHGCVALERGEDGWEEIWRLEVGP